MPTGPMRSYSSNSAGLRHYPSRALRWLIPAVLLGSKEAVIVSPWLKDIPLVSPPEVGKGLKALLRYIEEQGCRLYIYLRPTEEPDDTLGGLIATLQRSAVIQVPNLHAKGIYTEHLALEGSFNLLWTSIHRNVESVSLRWHGRDNALSAARQAIPDLPLP